GRPAPQARTDDFEKAQDIARRYRCEFIDLHNFQLHHDLFKKIPVDLMFRYNFVPLDETQDGRLAIAIADPSQLMMIDEISLLLGKRIVTKVSTLGQISEILKKTEQSKRVLEAASEGFTLDVIREDELAGDETISIDRLTAQGDMSPIIRLVDTTIFTALQRRASDIHIETQDDSVCIKFRIDGVLTQAMPPIAKEHHTTIISRIKVMSELDISERRVPQDGRFRVKYGQPERPIDFRVSIMPSIHGEDAVLRVLDKESMSEKFHKLTQAMPPIAKEHHTTIISRIKVMSELDISERRVPQDGRFRVKYGQPERPIDFRVSIMPSIHGEDAVLRVLDKESMSEKFHKLTQAMPPIAKEHHTTIISRIKVMSELDISERRVPQDGRFRVKYGQPERPIDFRVSIMPSIHGEDAVLRVLDKESMSEKFHKLTLDVVGFDEDDLRKFRRYISEPYGMVLVTGPTGSGKTTTLYAAVNEIKTDEDKIITIEDPVEYQIRGVTQIPVNEKKGLTFARGLRSILRHDPDKIMVGEIRDTETAQIAIQSALTGHLVFTTVHANNVVDVIGRFLNMGVEPYNF